MRLLALAAGLALTASYQTEIRSQIGIWLGLDEDPHVQAAIELRCDSNPDDLHGDCAGDLEREFASGRREPEAIIRRHCTRFTNEWALDTEQPLPICTELYGGWIEG